MSAAPASETVTITINDIELQVPKGELIVESVKRLGLEIPIFCYHPRMEPVGMCRMCLVEVGFRQPDGSVRKMPKPQAGCTLPASQGMAVYTDSEAVHRDRKGVLEFLLVNHPLDCPICDRGGECPLQNNTIAYGPSTSRFIELKRHLPKAFPLSKYVTLDLERCIQCGRCVRFTEEISGDAQLAFRFRGASMQPTTFQLSDFDSKFSGNVIEICPVGALTNAKYRFRARPWDLETRPGICTVCSNGCNIWFDRRGEKMARINGRTNEAVNEEWTCDRGKFGHDFYNSSNRLTQVMIRRGDRLAPVDWSDAFEAVLPWFSQSQGQCAALLGPQMANESMFLLQKLFSEAFGSKHLDYRYTRALPDGRFPVQSSIASFENKSTVFVFGTSLADELPMIYLRVRKGWSKHSAKVVVASSVPTEVDSFAALSLRYREGTEAALAAGISQAVSGTSGEWTPERVVSETGVSAVKLKEAAEILRGSSAAVISTWNLWNQPDAQLASQSLQALADSVGGSYDCFALEANQQGGEELGIGGGMNSHEILQAAADGKLRALWLAGVDPFAEHPDQNLVRKALESVPFLVVDGFMQSEAVHYASVVLPTCAPAEMDGSYTNVERRVQRMEAILPAKGAAKASWRVYSEAMMRLRPETPWFNTREILEAIRAEVPAFAGCTPESLEGEGCWLGGKASTEAGAAL